MSRHIVIIQGHPDAEKKRFCRFLAEAYRRGAADAGHDVRTIDVASLEFPLLRTKAEHEHGTIPACISEAQGIVKWADHLVIIYPLWMGDVPALLKAFLEQLFRPGFAYQAVTGGFPKKLLKGKSARMVVTMGMPAFAYRWFFCAHGLKNLKRSILGFCGIGPIVTDTIGMVDHPNDAKRQKWLERMFAAGRQGN